MIVPFPAGGGSDILARIIAEHMRSSLGQPVIVENVGGAGGTIGTARVTRSAPDGYTIGFGQWTSHVGSGALYPMTFDLLEGPDAGRAADHRGAVADRPRRPAAEQSPGVDCLAEGQSRRRRRPAPSAQASGTQLCLIYFQQNTRTNFQLIPVSRHGANLHRPAGGTCRPDVPGGRADAATPRSGKIKAYAVMDAKRWFAAPEVPTTDEAGAPGLHMTFWYGLWAPARTPKDIVARLNAAVIAAFDEPRCASGSTDEGHIIPTREKLSPEALGAHHKAEIEKWWPMIKAAGIKLQ